MYVCCIRSVSVGRGPASYAVSRQASRLSTASTSRRSMRPCPQYHPHKESVSKIALDGIRSMWVGGSILIHTLIQMQDHKCQHRNLSNNPGNFTLNSQFSPHGHCTEDDIFCHLIYQILNIFHIVCSHFLPLMCP